LRDKIFGVIGVLWGGAILVSAFVRDLPEGSAAYARGQSTGFVFGALLLVVGAYYLLRGSKSVRSHAPVGDEHRISAVRRGGIELLRLLVAAIAGLVSFFPLFWLSALASGSNSVGVWVALPLGFIGVPVLVLKLWRPPGASA